MHRSLDWLRPWHIHREPRPILRTSGSHAGKPIPTRHPPRPHRPVAATRPRQWIDSLIGTIEYVDPYVSTISSVMIRVNPGVSCVKGASRGGLAATGLSRPFSDFFPHLPHVVGTGRETGADAPVIAPPIGVRSVQDCHFYPSFYPVFSYSFPHARPSSRPPNILCFY